MRKTVFLALACSMLFSSAAAMAGSIKPGLWEMNVKSNAMQNMPKMSPEQMEKMKQMGISVPQMQDGGMIVKMCMTKEMVEHDQPPQMNQNQSGCQVKNYKRNGGTFSADMVCDGPNMQGVGTMKGEYSSSESFSNTYDFKGTAHGRPVNHHQEAAGKWLAANCGDVKPYTELMPKK